MKRREEKNPRFLVSTLFPEIPRKILSLNRPMKFRPKKIMIIPETMLTAVVWFRRNEPTVPASAPKSTKIIVKPRTKPKAHFKVFEVFLSLPPAKYEI